MDDNQEAGRPIGQNLDNADWGAVTALADPALALVPGAGSPVRMMSRKAFSGGAEAAVASEPVRAITREGWEALPKAGAARVAGRTFIKAPLKGAVGESATEVAQTLGENAASNTANGDEWNKRWGKAVAETIGSTAPLGGFSGGVENLHNERTWRAQRALPIAPSDKVDLMNRSPTMGVVNDLTNQAPLISSRLENAQSYNDLVELKNQLAKEEQAYRAAAARETAQNTLETNKWLGRDAPDTARPGDAQNVVAASAPNVQTQAPQEAQPAQQVNDLNNLGQMDFDELSQVVPNNGKNPDTTRANYLALSEDQRRVAAARAIGAQGKGALDKAITGASGADLQAELDANAKAIHNAIMGTDKERRTLPTLLAQRGILLGKVKPSGLNEFLNGTGVEVGGEGGINRAISDMLDQIDDNSKSWNQARKDIRKLKTQLQPAKQATARAAEALAKAKRSDDKGGIAKAEAAYKAALEKQAQLENNIADTQDRIDGAQASNKDLLSQLMDQTSDERLFPQEKKAPEAPAEQAPETPAPKRTALPQPQQPLQLSGPSEIPRLGWTAVSGTTNEQWQKSGRKKPLTAEQKQQQREGRQKKFEQDAADRETARWEETKRENEQKESERAASERAAINANRRNARKNWEGGEDTERQGEFPFPVETRPEGQNEETATTSENEEAGNQSDFSRQYDLFNKRAGHERGSLTHTVKPAGKKRAVWQSGSRNRPTRPTLPKEPVERDASTSALLQKKVGTREGLASTRTKGAKASRKVLSTQAERLKRRAEARKKVHSAINRRQDSRLNGKLRDTQQSKEEQIADAKQRRVAQLRKEKQERDQRTLEAVAKREAANQKEETPEGQEKPQSREERVDQLRKEKQERDQRTLEAVANRSRKALSLQAQALRDRIDENKAKAATARKPEPKQEPNGALMKATNLSPETKEALGIVDEGSKKNSSEAVEAKESVRQRTKEEGEGPASTAEEVREALRSDKAVGDAFTKMEDRGDIVVVENESDLPKGLKERAGKNEGVKESRSAIKSVEANIKRGLAAMNKALLDKTSIHRAMFRQGMGWVDFVWGDEGEAVNPRNGRRPRAKGISHIIEARQRKDGLTRTQTIQLLSRIVETIARGEEVRRVRVKDTEVANIQYQNVQATLIRNAGSNSWLLTGFELRGSDDKPVGYDSQPSTRSAPHFPDALQGAEPLSPRTKDQRHTLATDTVGLGEGPSIETNSSVDQDGVAVKKFENGLVQALFDPETGKTYIIASNIKASDAKGVFVHEVGVHMAYDHGNREVMKKLTTQAVSLINAGKASGNKLMERVWKRMKDAGVVDEEGNIKPGLEDEAYAYLAEEVINSRAQATAPVKSWFSRVITAVRRWLSSHGIISVGKLSEQDLVDIAVENVRAMARMDRPTPSPKGETKAPKFSMAAGVTAEDVRRMDKEQGPAINDAEAAEMGRHKDYQERLERFVDKNAVDYINSHMEPGVARTAVTKALDFTGWAFGKIGPAVIFTRSLVRLVRPYLPSVSALYAAKQRKNSIRRMLLADAEDVKKIAKGLTQAGRDRANHVIDLASKYRVFWSDAIPDYMNTSDEGRKLWQIYLHNSSSDEKKAQFAEVKAEFDKLSKDEKRLVNDYFKWTYNAKKAEVDAKVDQIDKTIGNRIFDEEARKRQYEEQLEDAEGDTASKLKTRISQVENKIKELKKNQKDLKTLIADEQALLAMPYAPHVRLGDHLIVGRSQELINAEKAFNDMKAERERDPEAWTIEDEKALNEAAKEIEKLKSDGKSYYVGSADGNATSRMKMHDLQKAMPHLVFQEPFPIEEASNKGVISLASLNNIIDNAGLILKDEALDAKAKENIKAINKAAQQILCRSLVSSAIQKHSLKRLNVEGYEPNLLRAFDDFSARQANHVASLATMRDVSHSLSLMINEKKKTQVSPENQEYVTSLLNEFIRRENLDLFTMKSNWTGPVARTTAGWVLFTKPWYYLQNITQPFMMSVPYMSGRITGENLYGQVGDVYFDLTKKFIAHWGKPYTLEDMVADKTITKNEAAMLRSLQAEGLLDVNMESEFGRLDEMDNKAAQAAKRVSDFFMNANQRIEQINRMSTALVAYRMGLKHPEAVKGMSKELLDTSAVQLGVDKNAYGFVSDVIERTHGDYSDLNAPSFMRANGLGVGGLEKLMFQFKKYSFIQMDFMFHMAKLWFDGATKEERAFGRRALLHTVGVTLATCGMMGAFPLSYILGAAAFAFGDDDDDTESYWRRKIGNDRVSDYVLHGIAAGLGITDLGKSIGNGDLGNIYPLWQWKHDLTPMENLLSNIAGPAANQFNKAIKGVGELNDSFNLVTNGELDPYFRSGRVMKAMEYLLPSGFASAIKAIDHYNNGVTSSSGNTMYVPKEEISFLDALCESIGMPPYRLSKAYWERGLNYDNKQMLKDRKAEMKKLLKEGHTSTVMKRLPEYNRLAIKNGAKPTTMADLRKERKKSN